MISAVRKLTQEDKDANHPYRVGALVSLQRTNRLWKYSYPKEWIINQGDTDTCGANSYELAKSIQEGRRMSGLFTWLMARMRAGEKPEDYGVDNRQLAMAAKRVGTLLHEDSPYDVSTPRETLVDVTKWPVAQLQAKALPYIVGSVVWVEPENGLDAFDMWCAATEKFEKLYGKPCPAVFGLEWNYDLHAYRLTDPVENGSGHDMVIIGREEIDYATALQSYGVEAGSQGEVKISRAIINRWAQDFGMFIIIDATDEEVKLAIQNGTKLDSYWFTNILAAFASVLKDLLAKLTARMTGAAEPMLWDTPSHCRRNVRVMCDEAGLSFGQKNTLCATIHGESQWNTQAICKNYIIKNGEKVLASTDRGLCQWNDYWHGEEITPDEALNNPEKAVSLMIQYWKAGQMKQWVAYSSGAYLKYLAVESLPSIPY